MIEAGDILKSARESSSLSLDEVSTDINIPVIRLEQIEAGSIGSFADIYELKSMLLDYAKYLGVNTDVITAKFNEYMFDYTSKIPMDEIEKKVREKEKEQEEESRVASPYTKAVKSEKSLPYIIAGVVIVILVILSVIWSIKQITIDNNSSSLNNYIRSVE